MDNSGRIGQGWLMSGTPQALEAGVVCHVLNRENARMCLFHKDADIAACEKALGQGPERFPVGLLFILGSPGRLPQ
jgi:hypothetical protein